MGDVRVETDGGTWSAWTSARITSSVDALCQAFEVSFADKAAPSVRGSRIRPAGPVAIYYRDRLVLTGWIDAVEASESVGHRALTLRGRSKTCDLVDCSLDSEKTWEGKTIVDIARDVIAPFGLPIHVDPSVLTQPALKWFSNELGETCAELLNRAARLRGCRMQSMENGGLWIARGPGVRVGTLQRGRHILSTSMSEDVSGWFSKITVVAQGGAIDGESVAGDRVTVTLGGFPRHRPLVIVSDVIDADLTQRGVWEQNTRVAQGMRLSISTPGWMSPRGPVWSPNDVVRIVDDYLGVDEDLAVVSTELTMSSDAGTITRLDLTALGALDPAPLSESEMEGF